MFVEDIKNDFYNILLGNRVLLLVHYDIDAICTCKILQGLFKCDNISYTLVPVGGIAELKTAYQENNEEVKYVILVNCGGTIDLVDILQPEEDVVFFVLDSHKPTDVCNVYSDSQVRLVYKDDEENIPNFDDIFRDDEDEEEEVPAEGGREALEAMVEKRREKRAWEERRHMLMFNYTQFSYYGKPSACIALDLAWRLSRIMTSLVWAGGVAVTSYAVLHMRSPAQCVLDASELQRCLARTAEEQTSTAKVVVEDDVCIPLYRLWSLEEALKYSPDLGPHLGLHSVSGQARLRQLLADMGFPLQQARQAYCSMDVDLRRSLLTALQSACAKHSLPRLTRPTFLLLRPHEPPASAVDKCVEIMALVEHESIPRGEGFQLALASLSPRAAREASRAAAAAAQRCLKAAAHLASPQQRSAGPFTYCILPKGAPETRLILGPLWLGAVCRWVSAAPGGARPVLVSAPQGDRRELLCGLPPRHQQEPRNLFGAAFEQAASRSGADVSLDHFESAVISLPSDQVPQFLDALTALLS